VARLSGNGGQQRGGGAAAAEAALLEAISGVEGRGSKGLAPDQQAAFDAAVEALEADGGVKVGHAIDCFTCYSQLQPVLRMQACVIQQVFCKQQPACLLPNIGCPNCRTHCLTTAQCKASMLDTLKRPHALTQAPTTSPQLEGRWRLLFTSKPGTASPIQRTFTGVNAFSIFQVPL